MLGDYIARYHWPGPAPCRECEVCKECPDPEYPEGFPVEDWWCVTTDEEFELMMWASGLMDTAYVYEDIMADQRVELEWWRDHCDYKAAEKHRDLEVARELNDFRRRMRLRAAQRAVEEHDQDDDTQ